MKKIKTGKGKPTKKAPIVVLAEIARDETLCAAWGRAVSNSPTEAVLLHVGKKIIQVTALLFLLHISASAQDARQRLGIPPPKVPVKIEYRRHDMERRVPISVQPVAVLLPRKVKSITRPWPTTLKK